MPDRPAHTRDRTLPAWLSATLIGGAFVALVVLEKRYPLRSQKSEPSLRRIARNLAVAATSAAAVTVTDAPVTAPLTRLVSRRRWGIVQKLRLPLWMQIPLTIALLDYTLYLWHTAFHKIPALWRFHQVHHVDLDMDTSTGIRFHFGEMVLSVLLRIGQILLIGVTPLAMSIWNVWLLCEVMFHHSNARLPERIERMLGRFIVTPRMHGIHHSIKPEELHSNLSSGLTIWDWLHGTLKRDVPQERITIGVAAYRDWRELIYRKLMPMPFRREQRVPTIARPAPGSGLPFPRRARFASPASLR
jgi:sterol desaturase/sphingolipid hydroxylase (fatty acid hydroxylase superfamily)